MEGSKMRTPDIHDDKQLSDTCTTPDNGITLNLDETEQSSIASSSIDHGYIAGSIPTALAPISEELIDELHDIEAAVSPPPSRQPISIVAPPALPNRFPRMTIDVDAFMENDKGTDEVNSDDASCSTSNLDINEAPSPSTAPKRSASQKVALNAALGYDCDADYDIYFKKIATRSGDSAADQTEDLTDDEIAAVIPPNFRRHTPISNSMPGAFRVHGRRRFVPPSPQNRTAGAYHASAEHEVVTTVVSATLVGEDVSGPPDVNICKNGPALVHAEPLRWKRQLVLCLSGWSLLAIGVISISVTLAFLLNNKEQNDDAPNSAVKSQPGTNFETNASPSFSPSMSPIELSPPTLVNASLTSLAPAPPKTLAPATMETQTIFHAVSLGKVSSCSDSNFYTSNDGLFLSCGGGDMKVIKTENVTCERVSRGGTGNATDSARVSCRLNATDVFDDLYTYATGVVLFSCSGTTDLERTATSEIPASTVTNCTGLPLPSSGIYVASAFTSLGRFCREFNHVLLKCEEGTSINFPVEIFEKFLDILTGKNRSSLLSLCYNTITCSSTNCSLDRTVASDGDLVPILDSCAASSADMDSMWETVRTKLEPSKRISYIIEELG
jgi:hypothetical protein